MSDDGPEPRLTPAELETAGIALYGKRWQSDLARALGLGSARIREWMRGARRVQPGIRAAVVALLREKGARALAVADELDLGHANEKRPGAEAPRR